MEAAEERRLMAEGADLFNAGRFFDCHEVWEDVWNAQPPSERQFLQGLIQIAVGCEHFNRGNLPGAVSLLDRGLRKIRKYGGRHRGVRLAQLERDAGAALDAIKMVETRQAPAASVRLPTVDFDPDAFVPAGRP
jgi:predicted metal-dependent hydrolase